MGDVAMLGRKSAAGPQKQVSALDALNALDFIMGWAGGFLELRVWHPVEGLAQIWIHGNSLRHDLARYVLQAESMNADVEVSLPRPQRGWGTVSVLPVVYVELEGKRAAGSLRAFRPVPTVVLREGVTTRYTAFWALSRPLTSWGDMDRANRRVAHALGAPKKHADPDNFYWVPPGSVLRRGRRKAMPVVAARVGVEMYTPREVVGHLREAPDPNAWREAPGNTSGRRF